MRRHEPGLVRIERFDGKEQALRVHVLLHPPRRLLHDLRVEPEFLAHAIAHVEQDSTREPCSAEARLLETRRLAAQFLQLARNPVIDLLLRRPGTAARRVGFLTADERPLVKAAPEVLRWLELV